MAEFSRENESKCSVKEPVRVWIESSFTWMIKNFGIEQLIQNDPLTPDYANFPFKFTSKESDAENAVVFLCTQMNILEPVKVHVYQEGLREVGGLYLAPHEEERYSSGLYWGKDNDGVYHVGLEKKMLGNPKLIVGVLSHELSHIKLLGEERIRKNNEHLTDLTSLFFGTGIFNAVIGGGYLSEMEWGYALAIYAYLRGEEMPEWINFLDRNIKLDFKQSSNFIRDNSELILASPDISEAPMHPNYKAIKSEGISFLDALQGNKLYDEYRQAYEFYREKRYLEAGATFYIIFCKGDRNWEVLRLGFYALLVSQEFEKAVEMAEAHELLCGMTSEQFTNIASANASLGQMGKAIAYCEKALEQNPFNSNALNNMGYYLNRMSRFDEALEFLDEALELDPSFAIAYNNRGLAKIKVGKLSEGLIDIERSLKLSPDNAYSYRNKGVYHLEKQEYEQALNLFQKAKMLDDKTDNIDELIETALKA